MRKQLFLGAIASLLMASCSNELDMPQNTVLEGNTPLKISVTDQPISKATGQSSGTSLSTGAEIGVFVTTEDGASYDSQDYNNIKFTSSGTGVNQTWAYDEATPVMLSSTKGKVYAYYPRQTSGASLSSITISNDGNDWMYTRTAVSNVSMLNPTASLAMEHAMSIIRVKVVATNSSSTGTVSQLTLDGSGWATSATLNLQNGTIGSYVGEGTQLVAENLGTLSTTGLSHDFWAVSNEKASVITFKVNVGENVFKVKTPAAVTLERGKVYTYVLNVENAKAASLSSVSTKDWTTEATVNFNMEFYLPPITWDEAKTKDGVYGMMADGKAMVYEAASTTSESLTGVAFVLKGKAYQVAKVNATENDVAPYVYWHKTGYSDISGLENFTKVDGTNRDGYLTGTSTPQLSRDPATWTAGALSDFNGQANTATILAAQNNGADDNTIGKAVVNFRNGSKNEGYNDWFVPSCGELAFMFLKKAELNTLLRKVGGSSMSYDYWSSTEYSSNNAWAVDFSDGSVDYNAYNVKYTYKPVRLVRAI